VVLRLLAAAAVGGVCLTTSAVVRQSPPPTAPTELTFTPSAAGGIPTAAEFDHLVRTDPIAAVEAGIRKYQRDVTGFRAVFHKRERIGGKLRDAEVIRVAYRDEPFAVLMKWEQGGGMADATLYVQGENAGQMQVKLARIGLVKGVDPRSAMPRSSARYTIEEFGLAQSMKRTHRAWTEAKAAGQLKYEFVGRKAVDELGGRECYVLKRHCPADEIDAYASGESEDVTDKNRADSFRMVTLYLDCQTWLQVGTELHRADGEPAGSYFFRDVELNPAFERGTFTVSGLKK
jgi:hypothetical protein